MQNVKVTTFNVGQGLFNLVRGIKDDGTPYYGVFDCGNFEGFQSSIEDACNLLTQDENFTNFDDVVISHQDIDHWRMFLDFILLLNGYRINCNDWYKISNIMFFNYISDSSHQWVNISSSNAIHNIFVFSKIFRATASGNITRSNGSEWSINVYEKKRLFYITIKQSPHCESNYYISFFSTDEWFGSVDPKNSEGIEIRGEIIDMIGASFNQDQPAITDEIYIMINTIFRNLGLKYEQYENVLKSENCIQKGRIGFLHLGGELAGNTYSSFCSLIGLLASITYHAFAYTQIMIDNTVNKITHSTIHFEYAIKGHTGSCDFESPSIYKNATSQVTSFVLSNEDFILFPGDATVHTFSSIIDRLIPYKGVNLKLFIAPHHGSYHTNFAYEINENRKVVFSANQPLDKLLAEYPPQNIHISANRSRFGHPSESFVNSCEKYCSGLDAPHEVVYCPDGTKDIVVPKTTKKAIYTTENRGNLLFPPPPSMIDNAKASSKPIQLPDNDLFIPYGGFNL